MAKWLTVPDVVQLLHVPEATIYRWIRQGDLPCRVRRGKYYFNQATLSSWAESKHIHLEKSSRKFQKRNQKQSVATGSKSVPLYLFEALRLGGVYHAVTSESVESFFQEVASRLDLPQSLSGSLAKELMSREQLSSTGIGYGIAVPHPQTPLGQQIAHSVVGTFFLKTPLDFQAPDGEPVFAVFVLLSTDASHHLQLLSQLARFLRHPEMNIFLKTSPSLENLVGQFQKILAETTE